MRTLPLVAVLVAVLAAGCGAEEEGASPGADERSSAVSGAAPQATEVVGGTELQRRVAPPIEGGTHLQRQTLAETVAALGFTEGIERLELVSAPPPSEREDGTRPQPVADAHWLRVHGPHAAGDSIAGARSEWQTMVLLRAYGMRLAATGDRTFAGGELSGRRTFGGDNAWFEVPPDARIEDHIYAEGLATAPGCSDPEGVGAVVGERVAALGLEVADVRVGGVLGCVAQVDAITADPGATAELLARTPVPVQPRDVAPREGILIAIRDADGADVFVQGIAEAAGGGVLRVAAPYSDAFWESQTVIVHG